MSRLRIKCVSPESWADLNWKIGKHFKSKIDVNKYLGIHLSHDLILFDSDSESIAGKPLAWVMSWIDSNLRDTAWAMSWFQSVCRRRLLNRKPNKGHLKSTLEWEAQQGHAKSLVGKVECPKEVTRNWEWIASFSNELIRIKILKDFLSRELFELKFWKLFE